MTIPAFLPTERDLAALLARLAQSNADTRNTPTPVVDLLPVGGPGARLAALAQAGLDFADGVVVDACLWIDARKNSTASVSILYTFPQLEWAEACPL